MLYKFKSKAAGDVIMLEPNGKQVLQIIGKDAGPKGIIEPSQMDAAIAALESAIVREEADRETETEQKPDGISLRQRALPLIDMMRRAKAANEEIVWGV
ncbi:MAG: DUF1840 domain-containing protein [Ramlibacter sp.]|nr:DUF1840 domain-containing protein [Ramlibacter sp.]